MIGLQKAGYFLMGVSGGLMLATLLYERELNKPVGEIEEYIPAKDRPIENVVEEAVDHVEETVDDKINDLVLKSRDRRRYLSENDKSVDKVDYKSMYHKSDVESIVNEIVNNASDSIELSYSPTDDEPVDEVSDDDLVRERVEEWTEIYLDENPQDFITLIFYVGDETLCDDREQLISNPEEVVGSVALERLVTGGPGAENGTIFVRNLKTMLNYEVVLDAGKYGETVLGIFENSLNKGDGGDVGE